MAKQSGFQLAGTAAERYERTVAPIMAPFVRALLDRASIRPGSQVLDLACGTGFVARSATILVGESGRVVGVDVNAPMLATAEHVSRGTDPAIEWIEASADAVPLPDATFDAVVCQQGMQFFPDLGRAAREVARLVRPGGRVGATVWSPVERSPYFAAQGAAVASLLAPEDTAPFAAAFACTADELAGAFSDAGLEVVETSQVVADITLHAIDEFIPAHLLALPWGSQLAATGPDGLEVASRLIRDQLDGFITATDLTAPFASELVVAMRPQGGR